MTYITEEILDKVLDKMDALEDEYVEEVVSDYYSKQPFLMMYIAEFAEDLEDTELRDSLMYCAIVALDCFYSINPNLTLISMESIQKSEMEQLTELKRIEKITDIDKQEEAMMLLNPVEYYLFSFIYESLELGDEIPDEADPQYDEIGGILGCMNLVVGELSRSLKIS